MDIKSYVTKTAAKAKDAARKLATTPAKAKNKALLTMADKLMAAEAHLVKENYKDITDGEKKGLSKAMLDRLTLNPSRIEAMANGLREIAALPDPVGEVTKISKRPNGMEVGRIRVPIGLIGIVYESRPNVTADSAALCLKSGNGVILRGGSEAINSNLAIVKILQDSLQRGRHTERGGELYRDDGQAGRAGDAETGQIHRPHHPEGRRGPDKYGDGELTHPRHKARQGRLPHIRGRVREPRHGARHLHECEGTAARHLQRDGVPCWSIRRWRKSSCRGSSKDLKAAKVKIIADAKARKFVKGLSVAKEEDW